MKLDGTRLIVLYFHFIFFFLKSYEFSMSTFVQILDRYQLPPGMNVRFILKFSYKLGDFFVVEKMNYIIQLVKLKII